MDILTRPRLIGANIKARLSGVKIQARLTCTNIGLWLGATFIAIALSHPAIAAEKNYSIGSFDNIQIEGDIRVNIMTGKGPSARAIGPQKQLDMVIFSRNARTLKIQLRSDQDVQRHSNENSGPLQIFVSTHRLIDIDVNGNGTVNVDNVISRKSKYKIIGSGRIIVENANITDLEAKIWGGGDLSLLSGNIVKSNLGINGFGSIRAAKLEVETATIEHQGPANTIINVSDVAQISNNGTGRIEILGRANCLIKSIGSGKILCESGQISDN